VEQAVKSNLIDILGFQHVETERAIRFSETGDDKDAVWLPKSQIEIEPGNKPGHTTVTMPEWLAKEKGLI
jgi:hypothetical protein